MADTPAHQSPARTQPETRPGSENQYWCYHCDKRVAVETLADLSDVVCYDCKNGFVESISAAAVPSAAAAAAVDPLEDPNIGSQFIQVLRLLARAPLAEADDDAPQPPPVDQFNDNYLQIELDEWDNDDDDDEEEEDGEDEHSVSVGAVHEEEAEHLERGTENNRSASDGEEEDGAGIVLEAELERQAENDGSDSDDEVIVSGRWTDELDEMRHRREEMRQRRRDLLRLQLREFASRAASRRNRILDWADVLMGLENHSIELTLQVPDSDTYVGNPGDYVDASEYEALLQNLAESDSGARRGAPPASKSAVEGLESVEIDSEENTIVCSICKDSVNVGEIAKNLPCGHGYHGECIVPWLGSRNSCPVCRFELPTDDPEYEEARIKRVAMAGLRAASSSSDSALE